MPAADRPVHFTSLIGEIQGLRLQAGRPHWLVVDEAHHVLPSEWGPSAAEIAEEVSNLMLITVHPEHVSPIALKKVNTVFVVGREPKVLLNEYARAAQVSVPRIDAGDLARGEALLLFAGESSILTLKSEPPRQEHYRHRRKYAEGQLDPEQIFHFKGPADRMDLRAHNLNMFIQLADGIDAETWRFHLKRGDYSNWLRHAVRDPELATQIETIEKEDSLADGESRERVRNAILQKYTAPA